MLSDSESDHSSASASSSTSVPKELTINEHYAKAFQYKKEREELAKLKEKYGSDYEGSGSEEETDSEEDVSEDEDGEELTPAVDAAILRTLARIKRKDPAIYDAQKPVFEEEQRKTKSTGAVVHAPRDKSKPITVRQAALDAALHFGSRSPSPSLEPLPHAVEQRALRDETIAAFHHAVAEDEDDGLLVPREKTRDEREQEEEEYRAFLEREVGQDLDGLITVEGKGLREEGDGDEDGKDVDEDEDMDGAEKKKKKKKKKSKSKGKAKAETDQEFLMNYILNRGWIDRSAHHIPTYNEITGTTTGERKEETKAHSEGGANGDGNDDGADDADPLDLSDAEKFEDVNDVFESSYNFRFEEPDAAEIKTFPRNIPSAVRREDTTRKDARERRKARKAEELAKRKEEVKRLKALKMREVKAKLEMIGREGGRTLDDSEALRELDLDGDWDPEAHDRQMMGLYGEDDDPDDPDAKPQWEDDIDIGDIDVGEERETKKSKKAKKKEKEKEKKKKELLKKGKEVEDDGVDIDAMDADVVGGEADEEEWDGTEEMRKRKLDEYMDELYGLDFNDIVGGQPTRFKYTPVLPSSFALTPAEILTATDAELNQYISVKKYAPYRKGGGWDEGRVERLKELKGKVGERLPAVVGSGAGQGQEVKKRKGKKERMKMKEGASEIVNKTSDGDVGTKRKRDDDVGGPEGAENAEVGASKKKRRRQKKTSAE
ncbi:hypothetical protein PLICRDRAFT_170210 [Plicaturopsis crispa FD-325 SS-3]|nr:hypothetical protein PLICRDRAFT_170210 [Plicaturopsis crispa FD-325 SS-3]